MKRRYGLFIMLAGLAGAQVAAADIEAGKVKSEQVCVACHGQGGNSANPDFPKLAGQYRDYLAQALNDYKSGKRKNAIMGPQAQGLTKQDIQNLAAYFSAQPGELTVKQ
ncbi:cytochrome c553 [Chitinivorax tropicus]|uniref:Cytochrome c553 n=1 Tax=Chitinivorax tropicus TaxID=714531 RepID=A0A840MLJ3_9PROT|nr:cytochrome c [Chitinivorax tropicus]MBB5019508.1 cytochrome c553 [Chitinivorax tropicus]